MKKVAFHNLGCKVNSYELEYMQQEFEKKGYEIVPFATKADIYVVNTCTVTNIADRKSRQMLHRAKKQNPDALVVAVGCYVQTDPKGALSDPMIDLLVGNNHKREIVSIVEEALEGTGKGELCFVDDLSRSTPYEELDLAHTMDHSRVSIKIQDGCDQFCSYCIIPHARGRSRSREQEGVLKEISQLAKNGYREVILTGIHLSSYGLDDQDHKRNYNEAAKEGSFTNTALLSLIEEAAKIPGIERIRLGSLEPRIITEAFLDALLQCHAFCNHFHLSLQSGSDPVLQRMNRHYSAAEYRQKVDLIRSRFPDAAITTDVIVGFPGETKEEFEETRRFLEAVDFYEVHVFKYSRRKGTVADTMQGQLTEAEKEQRSQVLIREGRARTKRFLEKQIGTKVQILAEEPLRIGEGVYWEGFGKNYIRCAIPEDSCRQGDVVTGRITGFLTDEILEVSIEE